MSLINNLIRRARLKPTELTINDSQVGTVVEHYLGSHSDPSMAPSRGELEQMIRDGKLQFMAIPVRVLGVNQQSTTEPK